MKQQPIPSAAIDDPNSFELLRAWVADEGLHCSLIVGTYGDRETWAWGVILADAARHIADALALNGNARDKCLDEIRDSFEAELDDPSSKTKGSFVTSQ